MTDWLLRNRQRVAEVMDDPALDQAAHRQALAGLGRINRWSGSARAMFEAIARLPPMDGGRPIRVLDVACGGGDVAIGLYHLARQYDLPMQITAGDISDTALSYAQEKARLADAQIHFVRLDALAGDWPGRFDVMMSTLFFHHLQRSEILAVMKQMREQATVVLIDDLRRTPLGYVLAFAGTRLLSRSRVVHVDGPRSVRGALTIGEMSELAAEAGLVPAAMYRHWPQRMLFCWDARHAAL